MIYSLFEGSEIEEQTLGRSFLGRSLEYVVRTIDVLRVNHFAVRTWNTATWPTCGFEYAVCRAKKGLRNGLVLFARM
jgi:hypothetical protein